MSHNIFIKKTVACLLLLALFFSACKKLIELPGNPPSSITEDQQFLDSASAMTAIVGTYSYFTNGGGGFTYNDAQLSVNTGLSSDELNANSTDVNISSIYSYKILPLNTRIATMWNNAYSSLYSVNSVLSNVESSETLSPTFKKQIPAEMKVLRSLYYFTMVNLFGGVPLVTTTNYKVASKLPRASVEQVYAQIVKDLTDASEELLVTNPSEGRMRPNRYTALTLLAKTRLYQKEWQAAYDAADQVITSNVYSLETDLNKVFLKGSTEAIWQLPALNGVNPTREATTYIPATNTSFPTYPISTQLMNAFENADLRLKNWIGTSTVTTGGVAQPYYYPFKYKNRSSPFTTTEDFMIFRLAELYLIRAEAAAQLNKLDVAVGDIKTIRSRAGLPTNLTQASGQSAILAAVMKERQTELFTEWGNRWFDLKRTGMADAVLGTQKTGWTPEAALYPIPELQRRLNFYLTQNPGYN